MKNINVPTKAILKPTQGLENTFNMLLTFYKGITGINARGKTQPAPAVPETATAEPFEVTASIAPGAGMTYYQAKSEDICLLSALGK